jgi:hypothetical protein
MSLLTLDCITLFFYELSEASYYPSQDENTRIQGWLSDVRFEEGSRKRKSKNTHPTSTSASESLAPSSKRMKTAANTTLSTRSTLSGTVGAKVAEKHDDGDDEQFQRPGGLSDHDEVNGDEHDGTIKSPPKPLGIRDISSVR